MFYRMQNCWQNRHDCFITFLTLFTACIRKTPAQANCPHHTSWKNKQPSGRLLCIWATFCFLFFCTDLIAITKGAFVRMRRIEIIVSNLRYRWLLSQVQYSLYYKCYRYHLAYWRLRHFRLGVSFYPSASAFYIWYVADGKLQYYNGVSDRG